jgi:hypothetical protein
MEPGAVGPGRRIRGALSGAALLLALALPGATGAQVGMSELRRTGDLICELYRSGASARRGRAPDVLLVFDSVASRAGSARVVSSRRVGAHGVRVYAGETGLHLVEDLNGSVVVTTLLGCEARSRSGRCQRYTTVNAWHFDQSVHVNPDKAFRRLPGTSYTGYCEAWYMEDPVRAEADALTGPPSP